jgi:hypothetical protein
MLFRLLYEINPPVTSFIFNAKYAELLAFISIDANVDPENAAFVVFSKMLFCVSKSFELITLREALNLGM